MREALPEALERSCALTGEKEVDEGENGVGKEGFDMGVRNSLRSSRVIPACAVLSSNRLGHQV